MATTPNYGWVTPAPTDLVTDLPADFETFADAVDADLAGLLGGTTGQILKKISGTDHDFDFVNNEQTFIIALSDETTDITTGTAKVTFRAPYAFTITSIPRASLATASSSGIPTVDVNVAGSSILTNKLTIDANELTSTTAATAATLTSNPTSVADDAIITLDIDVAGTGAKGLKVTIYHNKS
jgi:hypothetical protein